MLRAGGRSPRGPEYSGGSATAALHSVVRFVLSTISRVNRSRKWAIPGSLHGMDIEVRAVDPHDEEALGARHAVSVAVEAHDVPDFPPPCPVRYAGVLRHQDMGTA